MTSLVYTFPPTGAHRVVLSPLCLQSSTMNSRLPKKKVEVIFVSWDGDQEAFDEYFGEMPWISLEYKNRALSKSLGEDLKVSGIPTLVWVNPKTGEVNEDGCDTIDMGAKYYPWTAEMLAQKKADYMAIYSDWTLFDGMLDQKELTNKEAVAIFVGNHNDAAQYVMPKLKSAHSTIGGDRLAVVYACNDFSEGEDSFQEQMPETWFKLNEADSKAAIASLSINGALNDPTLIIVSGDAKLLNKDAARYVYRNCADGFPWSTEAIEASRKAEAEREAKAAAEVKEFADKNLNVGGLKFLTGATLKNKTGEEVAVESLLGNDLVGLYFSAHWCPPCRGFTPVFAKCYNELKAAGKSVEVIFVSSDRNQEAFDEYFGEMPWIALDFKDRALESKLSGAFDVSGIPTLVWVNPTDGKMITEDRATVSYGVEYFPWTTEQIAEAEAKASEREAKEAAEAKAAQAAVEQGFRDANTVVVKNWKGRGKVDADYTLNFQRFNTFVADCKLTGGKFYYELTCLDIEPVPQIGWYTEGFQASDNPNGEGIGDDKFSWGADGVRQIKWHNGSAKFGSEWKEGSVVGFAVDMQAKTISFSVDGSWEAPNGLAFENVEAEWIAPGLTSSGTYQVNFGDRPFKHAAPDESYVSVHQGASSQSS